MAASAPASADIPLATPPAGLAATGVALPHGLGALVDPAPLPSSAAIASVTAAAATLPVAVDLTADAPPVGDQGPVGSCAAWATDYAALGYWENRQHIPGGVLAPMYTYAQLVDGQDIGSYVTDHLDIAEQQGVDAIADYWQGNFDYQTLPTPAERANAAHWRLTSYASLATLRSAGSTVTQAAIETALAAAHPVVIVIPVYSNFFAVTQASRGLYASPSGAFAGYHAIAALGYDATGLRIENSWGTDWGDDGFATLAWSFVNGYVNQAVSVGPLVGSDPPPAAQSAPVVSGTPQRGGTLAATTGAWTGSPTGYAYAWQRDSAGDGSFTTIAGATAATYAPTAADVGARMRVRVTATSAAGAADAASNVVGPVAGRAPVNVAAPAVSGTVARGFPLTADAGQWDDGGLPILYAHHWQRDTGSGWIDIPGAIGDTYEPARADPPGHLRVRVTATGRDGSTTVASPPVGPLAAVPEPIVPVTGPAPATTTAVRGTPPDQAPPATVVSAARAQKAGRALAIAVACPNEACTATTTATIDVGPKRSKAARPARYRLRTSTTHIAAGARVDLGPALTAKARAAIRSALRDRRRVVATITITTVDAAGNTTTTRRTVTLRP